MPRPLTAPARAALSAREVSIAWLLKIELAEETIRACSVNATITHNLETYTPEVDKWEIDGAIGSISSLVPEPLRIVFDGGDQYTDGTVTRRILTQTWHLRPISLTGLLLDPDTGNAIGEFITWAGIMDVIKVADAEGRASIVELTCEGGAFRALSRNHSTCSDADQRRRDGTDTFFRNTGIKPSQNVPFGIEWSKIAGAGGGGGGGGGYDYGNNGFNTLNHQR